MFSSREILCIALADMYNAVYVFGLFVSMVHQYCVSSMSTDLEHFVPGISSRNCKESC